MPDRVKRWVQQAAIYRTRLHYAYLARARTPRGSASRTRIDRRIQELRGRERYATRLAGYFTAVYRAARRRNPRKTVAFDGAPVFAGLAWALQDARDAGIHFTLSSGDRRQGVAERFGHQSQAALYDCYRRGVPGCNPANPPGYSSHELHSDGNPVYGPRGARIPWFKLGLDVNPNEALVAFLSSHGYRVVHPYGSESNERHHISFTHDPTPNYRRRHHVRLPRRPRP